MDGVSDELENERAFSHEREVEAWTCTRCGLAVGSVAGRPSPYETPVCRSTAAHQFERQADPCRCAYVDIGNANTTRRERDTTNCPLHGITAGLSSGTADLDRAREYWRWFRSAKLEECSDHHTEQRLAALLAEVRREVRREERERAAVYAAEEIARGSAEVRRETVEAVARMVERGDVWEGHQAEGNPPTHEPGPLTVLRDSIVERIRDMASQFTSKGGT